MSDFLDKIKSNKNISFYAIVLVIILLIVIMIFLLLKKDKVPKIMLIGNKIDTVY